VPTPNNPVVHGQEGLEGRQFRSLRITARALGERSAGAQWGCRMKGGPARGTMYLSPRCIWGTAQLSGAEDEADEGASEAGSRRAGGPYRSELKAIGLARLIIGPLGTFLGAEGG
jgi:hypothetical protein